MGRNSIYYRTEEGPVEILLIRSPSTALRYLCLYSFFSPIEVHCEADFWMPKEYGVLSINGTGLAAGGCRGGLCAGAAPCPTQPFPAGSSPSGPTTGHSWASSKLFTDSNYSLRNTSTQEKEYYKVSHFFHFWKLLKRGRRQYQSYRWRRKEQESRKEEIWKEEWINTKVERRELVTVVSRSAKQG